VRGPDEPWFVRGALVINVKRLENFDSTVRQGGADFEMSLDSTCSTLESLGTTIHLVHMTCSD
jgi:hypothetical protein